MDPVISDRLRRLPKPELHVHLDGSLRPSTMFELARERRIELPAVSPAALAAYMVVTDAARLEDYLARFSLTVAVMQDAEALERIAMELVEDHADENVLYAEIRFCPELNTVGRLTPDAVLEAVLRGLRRGEEAAGRRGQTITTQLIVCALRSHDASRTLAMAELAVAWRARGVCGFDIAGAEAGHPVVAHQRAFDHAHHAGLPITIHAGEGFGAASIRQALEFGHASRIGHGTRLAEDPGLFEILRHRSVPLEMCLTSNVQTRVVRSHREHPARSYMLAGVPVSLATDNRLMSGVTLTREYEYAHSALGMDWHELVAVARTGFEYSFLPAAERDALLATFDDEVAGL